MSRSFFETTTALSLNSFNALKAEFSCWALPKLAETQVVIRDAVDPNLFKEMFQFYGKKEHADKMEDANEDLMV